MASNAESAESEIQYTESVYSVYEKAETTVLNKAAEFPVILKPKLNLLKTYTENR